MIKKILLLALLAIVFVSCDNSPEARAKRLIKEEMRKTLNDFSSYEPVEFSPLTDTFTDTMDDTDIPQLWKRYDSLKANWEARTKFEASAGSLYGFDSEVYKLRKSQTDSVSDLCKKTLSMINEINENFTSEKIGVQLTHSFRAKTMIGSLKLEEKVYVFDEDVTRIIRSYGKNRNQLNTNKL